MDGIFNTLMEFSENKAIINTHSHHLDDSFFKDYSLDILLQRSYVNLCRVETGNTLESRRKYLEKVRFNSYFVWLQKGIQAVYNIDEPLTECNWDKISDKITGKYTENESYHLELLQSRCHYKKVIRDTYWKPDAKNEYSALFAPAFRIDIFLFGYNLQAADHSGNNAQRIYGRDIKDIDEYVEFVAQIVNQKKEEGSVTLKSANAYDRSLDFQPSNRIAAQKAFGCNGHEVTDKDIKAFQDYIFNEICRIAGELKLPFQIHTGLGILKETNAGGLYHVIKNNPETKFVLLHGGYPWTDDICGLLHNFPNVYADLCWLPLISTTVAERMLHELVEIGTSDKICWGCDTCIPEESYGALMAVRFILAKVFAEKIRDGYLNLEGAKVLIENILYNNAKRLFMFLS